MTPAGYMAKRVEPRPAGFGVDVDDIFSVSHCISDDFGDYIPLWMHNGYWLFDSPGRLREAAVALDADLAGHRVFYYEVHEHEYDRESRTWLPYLPEPSFPTAVERPSDATLEGFDVVTAYVGNAPECSPLSCNGLGKEIPVNRHCLLATFEEAKQALESGRFDDAEPGPCRVYAVSTIPEE